ncbi:hypothetical protein [Actinophytocola sp.]|uniref:hypothetical protein n=1 Tax=Actinophytocola sp. TaxID=1872138 RepID=UPI003D6AEFA8
MTRAGGDPVPAGDVAMAFYGDLFRPPGELLAVGDPFYRAEDVREGVEQELLEWWRRTPTHASPGAGLGADGAALAPPSPDASG